MISGENFEPPFGNTISNRPLSVGSKTERPSQQLLLLQVALQLEFYGHGPNVAATLASRHRSHFCDVLVLVKSKRGRQDGDDTL